MEVIIWLILVAVVGGALCIHIWYWLMLTPEQRQAIRKYERSDDGWWDRQW